MDKISENEHLVIIGNGIAGVTLAQRVRQQSDCRITLVSAESRLHFSRTALMYVYMGHMRFQDIVPYADWYWQEKKIELVHDYVERVKTSEKRLVLRDGGPLPYDKLVLATGSRASYYDWPGQTLKGVQGLVSLQDLELMEANTACTQQAVIVGGGLIGVEMAEMLRSRGIAVTMLIRDKLYWHNVLPAEEAQLVTNHIRQHGIELLLQEELQEILADDSGRVRAIRTRRGQELTCQFVGITTGVKPNVDFLKDAGIAIDRGILVNEFFETSQTDVYAISDCAQFRNSAPGQPMMEQLWYTGRLHAEALAATLLGNRKPYQRGPWFNSAKFFDIEYQTYGTVPAQFTEQHASLYWQNEAATKAIRLLYDKETAKLLGINLLGIRYRHDLCHHWLQQGYTLHRVVQELPAVNFDPEFFQRYEEELLRQYYTRFPEQQPPVKHSSWWDLRKQFGLFSNSTSC
ncbi:NAD(P)/FAD-dependent oxidoreductase [Pontibacter ramchanderi]|uniref:Pyridine nucleotide-disulfide oxidoreductase n=1 Tax=Pontibacter ramchanderi TaxID=1179743 RepID=A0A2N3V2B8_9BACT|nr:FAD-dependent oxidoreductase [Pontibacter ramchanderi]PKV75784.1 pyridine nucleotide-disulfide oxidoreductase [Pontibacter ramchanderi]